MSTLSSALAAMDKATPGEFERYLYQHDVAKPALAWIKEALPWLNEMRLHVSLDPTHYDAELAALDALIARAKE